MSCGNTISSLNGGPRRLFTDLRKRIQPPRPSLNQSHATFTPLKPRALTGSLISKENNQSNAG